MKDSKNPMKRLPEEAAASDKRYLSKGDDPLFVSALARGLEVLRCLADAEADLTASEVARRLGLPQASVWRLCHTLLELGFLERLDQERLRPGLSVLNLGHAALARRPLGELGRVRMSEIATKFRGALSLGCREGTDMVYLQRVEGGSPIFTGLRVGARVSILSSAMGWAYLAGLPHPDQTALLDDLRQRFSDEYGRVEGKMLASIAEYAERKVVVNEGILHPELNAIAVPVGATGQGPEACLSFGCARSAFSVERLATEVGPLLLDLARSLSHRS